MTMITTAPTPPPRTRWQTWERRTLPWLTALAVVSLAAFVVNAAEEHPPRAWAIAEYGIWALFCADFAVRLTLAPDRRAFLRRNPIAFLALIFPAIRILLVLSIIGRLAVVSRRGRTERTIATAAFVVAVAVLALAAAVLGAERSAPGASITTLPDALWWAMCTTTTVGYGDLAPVTMAGRLYGAMLMIVGIGAMGAVTAALASHLALPLRAQASAQAGAQAGGRGDALAALERLHRLHREGALTPAEYAAAKKRLLSRV